MWGGASRAARAAVSTVGVYFKQHFLNDYAVLTPCHQRVLPTCMQHPNRGFALNASQGTARQGRTCTIWLSLKSSSTLRPPGRTAAVLQPVVLAPDLLNTTPAMLPAASSLQVTAVKAAGTAAAAVMLAALRARRLSAGPDTGAVLLMGSVVGAGSEGTALTGSVGLVVAGGSVVTVVAGMVVVVMGNSVCRGVRGTAAAAAAARVAVACGTSSVVPAEGSMTGNVGATGAAVTPRELGPPPTHAAEDRGQAVMHDMCGSVSSLLLGLLLVRLLTGMQWMLLTLPMSVCCQPLLLTSCSALSRRLSTGDAKMSALLS